MCINSRVKPFGDLSVTLSINPKDSGDFDMYYHLNKMPASAFNPYLISYTSFPMDRGTINLNGVWNVRNGEIKSVNHVLIIEPRLSKRISNKNSRWIPLAWVMPFVRERGNVIDYDIPISGNLKNPHFHLHDAVMDLLRNVFIKPVTIPYGIKLRTAEDEIENSLTLEWSMRQHQLRTKQKHFIKTMAEFLDKNKESSITVYSNEYALKEKEHRCLTCCSSPSRSHSSFSPWRTSPRANGSSRNHIMTFDYAIGLLVTAALLVYLTYALLRPGKF